MWLSRAVVAFGIPASRQSSPASILEEMSRLSRVLTGAVMLVVLLGLPVAPVWCELACPQGHGVAVQAAPAGAPCHEASAGSSVPPGAVTNQGRTCGASGLTDADVDMRAGPFHLGSLIARTARR